MLCGARQENQLEVYTYTHGLALFAACGTAFMTGPKNATVGYGVSQRDPQNGERNCHRMA